MTGFMAGSWLSTMSGNFAIELNGVVVGWQPGACWPRLRAWAFEHSLFAEIIGCVICIALGRAFAGAAAKLRLRASRAELSTHNSASPTWNCAD
jgi:hypothetical protein